MKLLKTLLVENKKSLINTNYYEFQELILGREVKSAVPDVLMVKWKR
jgi:hypothetical protein